MKFKDLILYVTSTCPHCKIVERYLMEQNIELKIINVETNYKAYEHLINNGVLGVPVLEDLEKNEFIEGSSRIIKFINDKINKRKGEERNEW